MSHVDFRSLKHDPTPIDEAGKQEFSIGSNAPLKCSLVACSRVVDGSTPFMILSGGQMNAAIFHLTCLGINPASRFTDPQYRAHVRDIVTHKLFGR